MRFAAVLTAAALAVTGLMASAAPGARAQAGDDPGAVARQIHDGCVRRGEDARVCACGVGIAYSKLEPAAFALIPQIDPLIDERDRTRQITGLLSVASASKLSPQQVQGAYETIRANRATVRAVCAPLAAARPR
ncbi:MAG: hypothetical protein NW200_12790 [Hyphomonadaceae bacterium]|nr:hypothetical protein [Hyphomonadaceae bacterium]